MRLTTALIGPFRSVNTQQTLAVDAQVTVLVGMNEAGKTVLLKALQKANDALGEEEFHPVEDYPRKAMSAYLKTHQTAAETAVVLRFELNAAEIDAINRKLGTSLSAGHIIELTRKYDNSQIVHLEVSRTDFAQHLRKNFSTDASAALKGCGDVRNFAELLSSVSLTEADQKALSAINARVTAAGEWDDVARFEAWSTVSPRCLSFCTSATTTCSLEK